MIETLNPKNLKGKLFIITRIGFNKVKNILPKLIEEKKKNSR